jgi:hypothetical protein
MRRVAAFLLLCAAVLLVSGCGSKESVIQDAETEGVTVDYGGLQYQVQISRFLNPNDIEDAYYLRGLPAGTDLDAGKDAVWFAVFIRVKNPSDETLTPTTKFTVKDTEGNEFEPVVIDGKQNPFIYLPEPLEHAHVLPDANQPAGSGPVQGAMILFKIDAPSLQNRPLILTIGEGDEAATVDLDL